MDNAWFLQQLLNGYIISTTRIPQTKCITLSNNKSQLFCLDWFVGIDFNQAMTERSYKQRNT